MLDSPIVPSFSLLKSDLDQPNLLHSKPNHRNQYAIAWCDKITHINEFHREQCAYHNKIKQLSLPDNTEKEPGSISFHSNSTQCVPFLPNKQRKWMGSWWGPGSLLWALWEGSKEVVGVRPTIALLWRHVRHVATQAAAKDFGGRPCGKLCVWYDGRYHGCLGGPSPWFLTPFSCSSRLFCVRGSYAAAPGIGTSA